MTEAKVFINGEFVGTHDDPVELVHNIRQQRRKGILSNQINVTLYEEIHEIIISSDMGRARRALIVVENGEALLSPEEEEEVGEKKIS